MAFDKRLIIEQCISSESIIYPFIQAEASLKGKVESYFISHGEMCTIVDYVKTTGMGHL